MVAQKSSSFNTPATPRVEVIGDGRILLNARKTTYRIAGDALIVAAEGQRVALALRWWNKGVAVGEADPAAQLALLAGGAA